MSDRRLTDLEIESGLRMHLAARPDADLERRIAATIQVTQQVRSWPSFVGALEDLRLRPGRRNVLVTIAFLLALALAATAIIGVLRRRDDDPLPTKRGLLAFIREGDLYLANPDGSGSILAADVDGTKVWSPHWSPNGRWVTVQTEEPAIVAVDSRTLDVRPIAPGIVSDWSPDGKRLAVATSTADLSIVDIETGDSTSVTPQAGARGFDQSARWSPDGRWLAVGSCCGASRLLRIDTTTGDAIALDPTESDWGFISAWSPDSVRVAFIQKHELRNEAPTPLVVVDADGSNRVVIAEAAEKPGVPHWSPDGAWIAYDDHTRRSLMVVRPDGTDRRRVGPLYGTILGWAPDGTSIAVDASLDGGRTGLSEVAIADGSTRWLSVPDGASGFAWAAVSQSDLASVPPTRPVDTRVPPEAVPATPPVRALDLPGPAGALGFDTRYGLPTGEDACETLLFRFPDQLETVVAAVDPTPTACHDTPLGDGSFSSATNVWSPDGTAFARITSSPTGTLEVFGLDGLSRSGPVPIGLGDVAWSPDGAWLSAPGCQSAADCPTSWFLVRPDGSDIRELPGRPAWSADGQWLSVERSDGHLLVGRPDGTDLKDIGSYPLPEGWSPSGDRFAIIRDGNLFVVDPDTGDAVDMTRFALGGVTQARWSPDGRWIAVERGETLLVIDPASGEQHRLGSGYGPGLAWAPGGASVTASRADGVAVVFDSVSWHPTRLGSFRQVVWSPDGGYLAGVEPGSSPDGLVVMNADGSGRTRVWLGPENSGASVNSLTWAP